ncbi:MAG TPA: hypothetical protein VJ201_06710 [Candidatus Babeliales bacterium]|nr:hypothetical protein [Candidatus Babeliales bacterium]
MKKLVIITFILNLLSVPIVSGITDLKTFGKKTLLIINFNHPYYSNIEFLKKLYLPHFPNIVFYGPADHPEVIRCDHVEGYFGYKVLADALGRYSNYEGYLYTNDDCILNFWNFMRFDPNKIWQCKPFFAKEDSYTAWWWGKQMGINETMRTYRSLPKKYINMVCNNYPDHIIPRFNVPLLGAFADLVYLPAHYREDIIPLVNIFAQHKVFLEIAMPTIVACLENRNKCEYFNGLALWDGDRSKLIEKYSSSLDYIHPVKLSDQRLRNLVSKQFDTALKTN